MSQNTLDIHDILEQIPHRYPFVLVDRVVDFTLGESIHAYKNVTINEPFFQGHFPHRPVMPGVLMLEALAQTAALLAFRTTGLMPDKGTMYYLAGIDEVRFKRPVEPGDQLHLFVSLIRRKANIFKFETRAEVNGEPAVEAQITCAMRDVPSKDDE